MTSEYDQSVMFGWFLTADIFGVSMHAAQSSVGNVLSNIAMCPPMVGSRSTSVTFFPALASVSAACIPEIPAPTTRTSG